MGEAAAGEAPDDTAGALRRPVLCRRCGRVITDAGLRLDVDGRHTHARLNPVGVLFVFDCYRDAPGCLVDGPPTLAATWFAAHAWEFAHCGQCGAHLGWRFTGPSSFFGLVSERVVSE